MKIYVNIRNTHTHTHNYIARVSLKNHHFTLRFDLSQITMIYHMRILLNHNVLKIHIL